MNTYKKIDSAVEKIFSVLIKIGGIMCFLMMLISVVNVISRSLFNSPIFGVVEIISYLALTLGAFSLAMNELHDGNVSMTLMTDALKPKARKIVDAVMSLLAAVFYSALSYRYVKEAMITFAKSTVTSTLAIPYYIINAIMAIGYFVAMLALLLKVARDIAYVAANGKTEEGGAE